MTSKTPTYTSRYSIPTRTLHCAAILVGLLHLRTNKPNPVLCLCTSRTHLLLTPLDRAPSTHVPILLSVTHSSHERHRPPPRDPTAASLTARVCGYHCGWPLGYDPLQSCLSLVSACLTYCCTACLLMSIFSSFVWRGQVNNQQLVLKGQSRYRSELWLFILVMCT